ncbi:MAG: DUF4215 domain-containing protein, partial [Myxococcales bacterium]|nr:DUF4215 domain-containing protein [Myxococcales bacterium]
LGGTVSVLLQTSEVCGNGLEELGEACDDGNTIDGDGCSSECFVDGPVCGDGIPEGAETCDDGNTIDGDGCSSECFVDGPVCGDGILEGAETCDDGNTTSGDGCDEVCASESVPLDAEVKKLQLALRFDKPAKDKLTLKLKAWVLPDGFVADGTMLSVNVGGIAVEGLLDAKGKFKSADKLDKITLKQKKKDGTWKLDVTRKKSDLAALLADEGLVDEDNAKPGKPVTIDLAIGLPDETYVREVRLDYKSKAGKKGSAK